MSENPAKDFDPIADDYVFFETHATEAEQDLRAYASRLADWTPAEGPIRMLDFGGGSGTFTVRFLRQAGWPPGRLQLTLVEPAESVRREAVARLASFTTTPVADSPALPAGQVACFDLVLANHVFYYVPDLRGCLSALINTLSPTGLFLTAIAGRTNAMYPIWTAGFTSIGQEIPYHTSEDVEAALRDLKADYEKEHVPYELTFPDKEANRMKLLRFLLADHLARMPIRPLLDRLDPHRHGDRIEIRTACEHYTIRPRQPAP